MLCYIKKTAVLKREFQAKSLPKEAQSHSCREDGPLAGRGCCEHSHRPSEESTWVKQRQGRPGASFGPVCNGCAQIMYDFGLRHTLSEFDAHSQLTMKRRLSTSRQGLYEAVPPTRVAFSLANKDHAESIKSASSPCSSVSGRRGRARGSHFHWDPW